uniref:Fascin domain-containing protein n=1 Tax=Hyaloperonospora arabidopsidis (strain Emoy2) TaxID=559515 RepID=M4B614_HYAAE
MNLNEIPFDVPVVIQSIRMQKNLQNPLGSGNARCLTENRDIYEEVILHRVCDDKIAIQCGHNGRFLQVRASGQCVFGPTEPGHWELFTMETDSNCALYFVSCHTGTVLQCDNKYVAQCANQFRRCYEAWRIVEPRTNAINSAHTQRLSDQPYMLSGKERQNLVVQLAKCGKTADEIKDIVKSVFDAQAVVANTNLIA